MHCDHYGICGGCAVVSLPNESPAPLPYPEQIREKELRVRGLLAGFDVDQWRPIVASPDPFHYRNKMEFAYGETREIPFSLGLREAGRFDRIVDLNTCLLVSAEAVEIVHQARQWAKAQGLKGYNRFSHQGELRYLVYREGINTGQRMAVLISRTEPTGLADLEARLRPLTSTCWLGVTDARGDVARAKDMRLLWGCGTIDERLGPLSFRISPFSFFQTNTRGTEQLYGLLQDWASEVRGVLLDLYCGSGGIALSLARRFDRVIGVDTNREAIEDARSNAERNGLGHVEFVCEDALDFLKKLPASKVAVQLSALVIDPPRAGLHPKAMGALLELNPAHLAYVSCNPESLARDLQSLAPFYRIRRVQPVDLFPHTTHVETVALLEHR